MFLVYFVHIFLKAYTRINLLQIFIHVVLQQRVTQVVSFEITDVITELQKL